jgi:hypothetical protein
MYFVKYFGAPLFYLKSFSYSKDASSLLLNNIRYMLKAEYKVEAYEETQKKDLVAFICYALQSILFTVLAYGNYIYSYDMSNIFAFICFVIAFLSILCAYIYLNEYIFIDYIKENLKSTDIEVAQNG